MPREHNGDRWWREHHTRYLTEDQLKAIEAMEWLYSDRNRRAGRTTAQAIWALRHALANPGERVSLHDHFSGYLASASLANEIRKLASLDHTLDGQLEVRATSPRGTEVLLSYRGPKRSWWPSPDLFGGKPKPIEPEKDLTFWDIINGD